MQNFAIQVLAIGRVWYGMRGNGKWKGTEILVWNVEDAGMEWKISRIEWKAIFHTNSTLDFVHCIHRKINTDVG